MNPFDKKARNVAVDFMNQQFEKRRASGNNDILAQFISLKSEDAKNFLKSQLPLKYKDLQNDLEPYASYINFNDTQTELNLLCLAYIRSMDALSTMQIDDDIKEFMVAIKDCKTDILKKRIEVAKTVSEAHYFIILGLFCARKIEELLIERELNSSNNTT